MASEQNTMQLSIAIAKAIAKAIETAKPEVLQEPQRFIRVLEDLCPGLQGEIQGLSRIYTKELGSRIYAAYEGSRLKKKDAWKPVQQYLEEELALKEGRCQEVLQWFSGEAEATGKEAAGGKATSSKTAAGKAAGDKATSGKTAAGKAASGAAAADKTTSAGKKGTGSQQADSTAADQAAKQRLASTLNLATKKATQLWKQSYDEAQKAEKNGNIVRAVQLYKSIKDGADYERDAQKRLGFINEKDPDVAYGFFLRAAQLGDAECAFRAGHMLENGRGVAVNVQEAIKYYKQAADAGVALAMHSLGYLYYMGKGVAQSYKQAFDYFQMASIKGLGMSMRNMGVMYENGVYVAKDLAQALIWYRKAEKNGYAAAADDCTRVRGKMNK